MAEQIEQLKIPGAAIGVAQGSQIVYVQGYGNANAAGRAVTSQTPFLLASLSKSLTALGIMQLVEAGQLNLDTPIQQYIPWFQVGSGLDCDRVGTSLLLSRRRFHHAKWEVAARKRNLVLGNRELSVRAPSSKWTLGWGTVRTGYWLLTNRKVTVT
jgi:hypothetical protein